MVIHSVPVSELSPDPSNARKHDEKNLKAIKGSLKKFGQQKPIVVNKKNVVIAGNGTLEAAIALGWQKINVVYSELVGSDATAFALADNRTTDLSIWDEDALGKTLQALYEEDYAIADIGFDPDDAEYGVNRNKEGLTDDDALPEVPQNIHGVNRGDIWQLGEHRLMCGDSTSKEDVEKLMAGEKADMVFTDPPYGGNSGGLKPYTGAERESRKKAGKSLVYQNVVIENDKNIDWLANCFPILPVKEESTKIVFFKWNCFQKILNFCESWGEPSALLVWDRVKKASAFFRFQPQHELMFHWGNQSDKRSTSSLSNVFSIEKDETEIHPTVKPIALLEPIVLVCTSSSEIVIDPFLGSGSTLIACEKTNRKCYGMEIDPHYCSVIIERWQQFTGKKAIKSDGQG